MTTPSEHFNKTVKGNIKTIALKGKDGEGNDFTLPPEAYEVIDIITTEKGKVYITNTWHKEHRHEALFIIEELVDRYTPLYGTPKVYVLIEEFSGIIDKVRIFLDEKAAKEAYMKSIESLGFTYNEGSGKWVDDNKNEVDLYSCKTVFHLMDGNIEDFQLDTNLLAEQIEAVSTSDMRDDHIYNVNDVLRAIYNSVVERKE